MTRHVRHSQRFALALMGLLAGPAALHAQDSVRPLSRGVDPLVVSGTPLSPLNGTPLSRLGCFRVTGVRDSDAGLEPIPCQVDERTPKGAYVFPKGPEADPKEGDGLLSPKDELVFMAHDGGPRAIAPAWPAGFQKGLELELIDPLDGGRGYVYLASFAQEAPRSPRDYVRYTPGTERVEGTSYLMGFSKKAPIVFDTLLIKRNAGGSGENPVDRMKVRLDARVWGTIPIHKTENDYSSEMIGYIDGPVRVIRRTRNRLVLFWKIPSPSAIQDNFFYDTFFEFPIVVTLPLDLDTFLSESKLRISVDLKGDPQRRFLNPRNRVPTRMDGLVTDDEKKLDLRPAEFSIVHGTRPGDEAGWFNRLSVGEKTQLEARLFYVDDATLNDPPEEVAGQLGNLGYEVPDLRGLTRGTHFLTSVLYSFPRYTPGLEQRYLSIKDAPLQVRPGRTFP